MLSPHIYAALVQERHQGFSGAGGDRPPETAGAAAPAAEWRGASGDGFARLSDRYRRLRFLSPKPALSPVELGFFADVDHHDHEAGALEYEITLRPAE